jgi:Zn-dependent protease
MHDQLPAWQWMLYIVILSSTLALHEIGHWAEMMRLKIPIARITLGLGPSIRIFGKVHLALFPMGASVGPDPETWGATSAYNRFRVALAGPVASFTCAAVLLALSFLYPHAAKGLSTFASLHFAIGAFNMLPIPPLDGWTVITELMAANNRPLPPRATAIAARLGNGMIYGFGFWFVGTMLTSR